MTATKQTRAKPTNAPRKGQVSERDAAQADSKRRGAKSPASRESKSPQPSAQPKQLSALAAAAKVLAEAGTPMNTRQLIEAMAAKEYWRSPSGKTLHATLYSAILREIGAKGKEARLTKTERGKFAATV